MKFIVVNTGYHDDIERYAQVIEDRTGMRINYDDENSYYYYVINSLTTLLKIVDILDSEGVDNGIVLSRAYGEREYVMEIYDDWRE